MVVLGAGATRGASLVVEDRPLEVLPPLDRDFFIQVQKIRTAKHLDNVRSLVSFKHDEFGAQSPSMESFFTQVEFLNKLETELRKKVGRRPERYQRHLDLFKQVLAALFEESLKNRECEYHESLVKSLDPADSIVSFNYDCLIDLALKKHGGKKWDPQTGYGVRVTAGHEAWVPENRGVGPPFGEPIKLYKMHGSLHWKWDEEEGLSLKERPYTRQYGDLGFEIIPPAWDKAITEHPLFKEIWTAARQAGPQRFWETLDTTVLVL